MKPDIDWTDPPGIIKLIIAFLIPSAVIGLFIGLIVLLVYSPLAAGCIVLGLLFLWIVRECYYGLWN